MDEYKCEKCGNTRWFYHDVSIQARKLIDLKNGKENGKIFNVEKDVIDNEFETIYCRKCNHIVEEAPSAK
ncbi:hypothetical protein P9597_11050 [Aneurinibacillus migulanus]|uniref:hypothetical protein n=1 Tax=Aneurinibacillus migulanus TaxID=47500 RepID=UPI002E1A265E|nr:hypothetical protein [Aneurinibacillus migulanus]